MIRKLLVLFLGCVMYTQAQIDSASSFYPLQTGNTWQYLYRAARHSSKPESTYVTIKVVGDTLMKNGKRYKIVDGPLLHPLQSKFQRMDPQTACVYCYEDTSEILTDSLGAGVKDRFRTTRCFAIETTLVLNAKRIIKVFDILFVGPSYRLSYAQNFGIVKLDKSDESFIDLYRDSFYYDLVYAKINGVQYGTLTDVAPALTVIPSSYVLAQNYPNPFNPTTTIECIIPNRSSTTLTIYDILGREVTVLIAAELSAGHHTFRWTASNVPSGVYFYTLRSGKFVQSKSMIVQK